MSKSADNGSKRPPVLFVHGAWHGAWCWEEHLSGALAAAGYDSYALDLKGHGADSSRLRFVSAKDFLKNLDEAVAKLPTPPVLIGHSMGGYLVQRYLETHQVPAVVLMASVPPNGALGIALRTLRTHPLPLLKTLFQLRLWPLVASPELARDFLLRADATDEQAQALHERLQDESFRAFLDMIFRRTRRLNVIPPTLVLGAGQDRLVSPKDLHETALRYNTEAQIFPGMCHDMMIDPEWESVASAIITWLDETL